MSLDNAVNFGKVTVSTGYDASAVSVVLIGGDGLKLPTVPFNATWWNATDYPDPTDDPNREIVRVTVIATDTLTVTRAQESTSASTKNTSAKTYKMVAALTAKFINTDLAALVLPVTDVTGSTQQMAVNNAYVADKSTLVTFTLPTSAAVGDRVSIVGYGSGGWQLAQNASQIIHFGSVDSTTGTSGYLASNNRYDSVELSCVVTNTDWTVRATLGAITVN
jgi:hypothetical protein